MENQEDIYEKLRKKLSRWPVKLPRSPEAISILKMLFNQDEAELILSDAFTAPYKDRRTVEDIKSISDKAPDEVLRIIEALSKRGLLFKYLNEKDQKIYYSLFPILPGFFEFYLLGETDSKKQKKFSDLMEDYYQSGLADEIGISKYPWVRILPSEKNLEVNIGLDSELEVLSFEKVSEYIKTSSKVALMNCACRIKSPCDHDLETCMCFDHYAEYMVERDLARYLTIDEAVKTLEQFETQGLVHTTTNCQKRPQFICNCCTCSCLVLRGLTEFNNPRSFTKSNFQPEWEYENCNFCETCITLCPMDAIHTSEPSVMGNDEENSEKPVLYVESCIGCGLCASNCPNDAVSLVKIRNDIPETTLRGLWLRTELERVEKK
jgi:Pyruvate/2-oxoacid:ferredoxin oxidoreductase delta subunit